MPEITHQYAPDLYEAGSVPINACGWLPASGPLPAYPALDRDLEADVVVIGAGLTGAAVALRLAQRNLSVVLLEAAQPADAASGRNAGHVLPYLGSLGPLQRWPDAGRRFIEHFVAHRRIVFDLCAEHGIEADADRVGCLEMSRSHSRHLAENAARWKALGCDVEEVRDGDLEALSGTRAYSHGLLWRDGGRVNPYLFTNGLVAAAAKHGARVHGDSRVVAAERRQDRWTVRTERGSVRAARVVVCTNGHRGNVYRPELAATSYPLTSCALATAPLPRELLDSINPSRATLQQFPAGLYPLVIDGRGRMITATIPDGGGAADAQRYFRRLLRYLHRVYPQSRGADIQLEAYWTGVTHSSSVVHHEDYPKLYDLGDGMTGILNVGTWGNVLGPLVGFNLADCLADERPQDLVLPMETPVGVARPRAFAIKIRYLLIPLARILDRFGLV